jgi:hypothetical protein
MRWANDIDGLALAAQPGKSQGRPMKSPGSQPIVLLSGLPNLRSPRRALSESAERRSGAGRQPSGEMFMPRRAAERL